MSDTQLRANQCGLCDDHASYLTPFGLLCSGHAHSFIEDRNTWLPIPLESKRVVGLPY